MLPQGLEAGTAHIALYKLGATGSKVWVAWCGRHRTSRSNCSMRALINDASAACRRSTEFVPALPTYSCATLSMHPCIVMTLDYHEQLQATVTSSRPDTAAEDPALIIYTSGTTGHPKVLCMPIVCCSGICPACAVHTTTSPSPVTGCGPRQTRAWIGGLPLRAATRLATRRPVAHRATSLCLKTYLPD